MCQLPYIFYIIKKYEFDYKTCTQIIDYQDENVTKIDKKNIIKNIQNYNKYRCDQKLSINNSNNINSSVLLYIIN